MQVIPKDSLLDFLVSALDITAKANSLLKRAETVPDSKEALDAVIDLVVTRGSLNLNTQAANIPLLVQEMSRAKNYLPTSDSSFFV